MVTVDFYGSNGAEKKKLRDTFISTVSDNIRVIPSLGDPATMMLPVEPVWGTKYQEPGMVRISAGFEDTDHLNEVLTTALKSI